MMNSDTLPSPANRGFPELLVGGMTLEAVRKDFHRHPEIAYQEHRTAETICTALERLGIPYTSGIAETGIVATLTGTRTCDPGRARTVGFRAELDALAMDEENDFDHRSTIKGQKHGCGHDGHMTMVLGLAAHLARNPEFDGIVRFVFQPAEEGGAGGRKMIEDGLLERFPVERIFALHNWPQLPAGNVGVLSGPIMAGGHVLKVRVRGKGGHAALPYACTDQLNICVQILNAMQVFTARRFPPQSPAVLTIPCIKAGDAMNVIPDEVSFEGTVRVLDDEAARILHAELPDLIRGIAAAWGAKAEVSLHEFYPVTINDPAAAHLVEQAACNLGLPLANAQTGLLPSMTSEDFSFLLQKVPGCMFWLGQGGFSLHHPSYDFNDGVLPIGVQMFAEIARLALAESNA